MALTGMTRIAEYLGHSGSYLTGRDLSQLIADAYGEDDAYGPEHRDAALLPIRERVSGPDHPDTLTARANLGYWTRN